MPTAAPRPCSTPGCPELVTSTRACPRHPRRPSVDRRPPPHRRGYTWQWRTLRAAVMNHAPPACVVCGALWPLELDHIVPIRLGGEHSVENCQWMCALHHRQKTARERER